MPTSKTDSDLYMIDSDSSSILSELPEPEAPDDRSRIPEEAQNSSSGNGRLWVWLNGQKFLKDARLRKSRKNPVPISNIK
jgi:hypothetical protein